MSLIKELTYKEAIKALPKRKIIHCFAGMIGADWDRKSVVKELKMAEKIGWVTDIFSHNLGVQAGEKSTWFNRSILRFDIKYTG